MQAKKAFISQPMKGKTRETILSERKAAVEALEARGFEVIDSVFSPPDPDGPRTPLRCLANSLSVLAGADLLYLLSGWDRARGCNIERLCALEYGVPVEYAA